MNEASTPDVRIDWHFAAAPAAVWRAWTDPVIVRQWWGSDPDGTVPSAVVDARPGGQFEIAFRDSDGDQHTCFGHFLRVAFHRELEFTWSWRSEANEPSRVRVVLEPEVSGTAMCFTHTRLRGISQHGYLNGWKRTFAKLDGVLTAAADRE